MSSSASTTSTRTERPMRTVPAQQPSADSTSLPVTPAVLRSIFASSRTPYEERSISRIAFFRFAGFLLSCVGISLAAARGRVIKGGATLLGVV